MLINISLLISAALIWGAGFIATKWTLNDYGPYWSNSLRFIIAGLFILPYLFYKIKKVNFHYFLGPLSCACILYISMQTQTIGLKYTTAAKSGFITTLYAFFIPILLMLFKGIKYQLSFWGLLAMSLLGIAMLCQFELSSFNIGDLWTCICALFFALHILITAKITNNYHPIVLNGLQCVFVGLLSIIPALYFEGVPSFTPLFQFDEIFKSSTISGFIIVSIFSSNIAFSVQAYAQKTIPPHIVGLIFLLESLFATIFGFLLLNEQLTSMTILGGTLILISLGLIPKFGRIIQTP